MPLAADPPPPPHRGTGLLPLLRPQPVPLRALVKVAGRRWTIEENFQAGKGLTGLDEHQVRRWTSWHRWVTLAMLAAAFLAIAAAAEHARTQPPPGQIPLTRNEIASLFTTLITEPARDARPPAALVHLATPPPAPRPDQPLPAASQPNP